MSAGEINSLSAAELAAKIACRDISPVEAVDAALCHLEAVQPSLNAFDSIAAEAAQDAARRSEATLFAGQAIGPLHGVPVSIKDLIDVAGLPARYGSLTLKDNVAKTDAPSVQRLKESGAIIIGKTTTSEFGYRGYTKSLVHGNTRNPWSLDRTPGGSSGGAVASVAAGVTAIALGTDGGGSVRAPCALTGLVGIKANFGRVPIWPASATPTLAHVGPIARSVEDAALLLRVISGPDDRDAFSLYPAIPAEPSVGALRGLKIAFSPALGYAKVDSEISEIVAKAIQSLVRLFPKIEAVDQVCEDPAEIMIVEFMGGCSAKLGEIVDRSPELIDPPLLDGIAAFRERTSADVMKVLRRRLAHREVLRLFFQKYDLLLTPTTPCEAWSIDRPVPPGHESAPVWTYFTYPFNLSGQPAGTIPCGMTNAGLPVGLQFVVPLCREDLLIASMRAAESVLDIRVRFPFEVKSL